jgi:predicted Fe-S protein YdhL (DUF1289 family)
MACPASTVKTQTIGTRLIFTYNPDYQFAGNSPGSAVQPLVPPLVNINSPCINICVIDAETGYCQGCFRTIDEISNWLKLPAEDRVEIIYQLDHRRQESASD